MSVLAGYKRFQALQLYREGAIGVGNCMVYSFRMRNLYARPNLYSSVRIEAVLQYIPLSLRTRIDKEGNLALTGWPLQPRNPESSRGGSSSPSETSALKDSQRANANATKATLLSPRPLRNLLATSPPPCTPWGSAEVNSSFCLFVNNSVATTSLLVPNNSISQPHLFLSRNKQQQCLRNTQPH